MPQQTKPMRHELDHVAGNTERVASCSNMSRPRRHAACTGKLTKCTFCLHSREFNN
jgi:hypothetical protein